MLHGLFIVQLYEMTTPLVNLKPYKHVAGIANLFDPSGNTDQGAEQVCE